MSDTIYYFHHFAASYCGAHTYPRSSYTEPLDTSCSLDGVVRSSWRPKEGVLLTTLKEHSGAVNRLVVSPDQAFFASASADRTVKVWQTRQLDRVAFPRYSI
jgi:WD40 repeat protein